MTFEREELFIVSIYILLLSASYDVFLTTLVNLSGTELWIDRQTEDPITKCNQWTFQAKGIKIGRKLA